MKRPGKAVFDASMMAGWAIVAVLTGLIALTMVDDPGEMRRNSGVVATLESDDTRIITGSIDGTEPGTASISTGQPAQDRELVAQQNKSFNPFANKDGAKQQARLETLVKRLNDLQREVNAFHTTTQRLREENELLKHRLSRIELGEEPVVTKQGNRRAGELVILSKQNVSGNKNGSVSEQGGVESSRPVRIVGPAAGKHVSMQLKADRSPEKADSSGARVDPIATGSIPPVDRAAQDFGGQDQFDPFRQDQNAGLQTSVQPLDMDLKVQSADGKMLLPKSKPLSIGKKASAGILRPQSEVVLPPDDLLQTSQTAFGLDLGQFRSLAELTSAWQEVSVSQRRIMGDLKPVSFVSQSQTNQLQLNLLAGPIQNAAQAAILCANLQAKGYDCRVSTYRGQALALK